jgi:hypothetical protein
MAKIAASQTQTPSGEWLNLARNAYDSSETWLMTNARQTWARSYAHYRSEHASDSPINQAANAHRSSYFYPKSRTLVRSMQAATAAAYFASRDVVIVEAEDADNKGQCEASDFMQELVNYRLKNTIPWYQIVLGAMADVSVLGMCASNQSWLYQKDDTGKVVKDEPHVRIVPMENIRVSPSANWIDPENTSPYLIELIPMFLCDVEERIEAGVNPRSKEPAWKDVGRAAILGAGTKAYIDQAAKARAGQTKQDPKVVNYESESTFRIVWIHRNIIRKKGRDWLFYTVGTTVLLSDAVPLADVIPWANGKRDYAFGKVEVETDRPIPSSAVEMISGLQKATNELKNQRFDNVRQVLNRRYLFRAGSQVDVRALSRNVPGGLIGISAPGALDSHVSPLTTPDVTSSSFQEEDRLNVSMDDLSGSSNASAINSNRSIGETATGMTLMTEAGNAIREMEIRTLTETWMDKALTQITQLEAMYETDRVAMLVSMKKAKLLKVLPEYFLKAFSVKVNVGMGATSPSQRLQRIQSAISTVTQLVPDAAMAIDGKEVAKEVFGAAGYDNGARFFDWDKAEQMKANPPQDPVLELQKQQLQAKQEAEQGKLQIQQGKLEIENQKLQIQLQDMQAKVTLLQAKTVTEKMTSIFEASKTAETLALTPGSAPVTDALLGSAGFIDSDATPIVPEEIPAEAAPADFGPENSHPLSPPNASRGISSGLLRPSSGASFDIRPRARVR